MNDRVKSEKPLVNIIIDKPWEGNIDRGAVYTELYESFIDYAHITHEQAVALTIWVRAAYNFNSFPLFMKLLVAAPTKRCGKTTLLECLSYVVPKAKLLDARSTPSFIEGVIERYQPTLLIDEGDSRLKDKDSPLASLILSSHKKKGAVIGKSIPSKEGWIPKDFSVWTPMAIAMNGRPIDTLVDRSLSIIMERSSKCNKFFDFDYDEKMTPLRRKFLRIGIEDEKCVENTDFNSLLKALPCDNPRASQNWMPQLTASILMQGCWQSECINSFNKIGVVDNPDVPIHVELLQDIAEHVRGKGSIGGGLSGQDIVTFITPLPDTPWSTHNNNRDPITCRQLAKLFNEFSIVSENKRWETGKMSRKYDLAKLIKACDLYKK